MSRDRAEGYAETARLLARSVEIVPEPREALELEISA